MFILALCGRVATAQGLAGGGGVHVTVDERLVGASAGLGLRFGADMFGVARAHWLGNSSFGLGVFVTNRWSRRRWVYYEGGPLAITRRTADGSQTIHLAVGLGAGFAVDFAPNVEARLVSSFLLDSKQVTRILGASIWIRRPQ